MLSHLFFCKIMIHKKRFNFSVTKFIKSTKKISTVLNHTKYNKTRYQLQPLLYLPYITRFVENFCGYSSRRNQKFFFRNFEVRFYIHFPGGGYTPLIELTFVKLPLRDHP